jgi:hypothetical protein
MRPTFTTGSRGEGQHHRHLQQHAEGVADVVGDGIGEALGAVAALQQEGGRCIRFCLRWRPAGLKPLNFQGRDHGDRDDRADAAVRLGTWRTSVLSP